MRRITALLASLGLTIALFPALALAAPRHLDSSGDRIPGSWIVTLYDHAGAEAHAGPVARQAGGRVGFIYQHALNGFSFQGSDAAAEALLRNPLVRTVVADRPLSIVAESVPTGVSRIDSPAAHSAESGAGARVAILDTGIDLDHDDLQANIDAGSGKNCIDTSQAPDDGHSHGTHVAGTVAAVDNEVGVIGVAPAATLIPVKVLDDNGSGSWASVICGVDHVTFLNTNSSTSDDVDVANMSLGGSGSATGCNDGDLHEAICSSVASGALYAVAAGNDSKDASNFVPAAYPEVLTVSAFQDTDGSEADAGCTGFPFTTCDEEFASFSNYGAIVDVIAPGVRINSTVLNDGYGSKSGTSMAAPHAAGVAALVRAANSSLSVSDVEKILEGTGQCPDDSQNNGDATCGGTWDGDPESRAEPMVNAAWAVAAAGGGGDDSMAPAAPSGLTAVAGDAQVALDWNDNTADSDLYGYNVYRSTTSGSDYAKITTSPVVASAYTDTGSTNGTTYYYVVTAVDTSNNESGFSNEASATPQASVDGTPPAAPSGLTAVAGDAQVALDWNDNTADSDLYGYNVYRSTTSGSDYAKITTSPVVASAYTDTGSTNGTTYYYVVTAVDTSNNESGFSNEASATPQHAVSDGTMHIGDLDGTSNGTGGPMWAASVTITVHDSTEAAVSNATVTGTFTYNGSSAQTSCATDGYGRCAVSSPELHKRYSTILFKVDSVTVADDSLTYDAGQNHDHDGDSDGTTISVAKPA